MTDRMYHTFVADCPGHDDLASTSPSSCFAPRTFAAPDDTGVSVLQVRAFVEKYIDALGLDAKEDHCLRDVIDFIDNGPKKQRADEVLAKHFGTQPADVAWVIEPLKKLREAGLLKDDA